MSIQTIAHYIFPAAIRDIGTGLYHLAKREATQEQCQKLIAGAIRVSAAALVVFSAFAATVFIPGLVGSIVGITLQRTIAPIDLETSGLASISSSVISVAHSVSTLATATTGQAFFLFPHSLITLGIGWFSSRVPRDINFNLKNNIFYRQLLTDKIDNLAAKWGTSLYHVTSKTQEPSQVLT